MTVAIPDWMVGGLSAADYHSLPKAIRHHIELLDGSVVVRPRPTRSHQRLTHRVANALATAFPRRRVDIQVELWLRDDPPLLRRPDIVVRDSVTPRGSGLSPEHCRLVVEVACEASCATNRLDEYAMAGIEHLWRVENRAGERMISVFRYRLCSVNRTYQLAGGGPGAGLRILSDAGLGCGHGG